VPLGTQCEEILCLTAQKRGIIKISTNILSQYGTRQGIFQPVIGIFISDTKIAKSRVK